MKSHMPQEDDMSLAQRRTASRGPTASRNLVCLWHAYILIALASRMPGSCFQIFGSNIVTLSQFLNQHDCNRVARFLAWARHVRMNLA